jgi:hypothetical protein
MNKDIYFYGIGTVFVSAVSAALIFGWAQGTVAVAQETAPVEMTAETNRLIRVVLASPYER